MGEPPPVIRLLQSPTAPPPDNNGSCFFAAGSTASNPQPKRRKATAFHKRKSKRANKLQCPVNPEPPLLVTAAGEPDEDYSVPSREEHAEGVVAAPGQNSIDRSSLDAEEEEGWNSEEQQQQQKRRQTSPFFANGTAETVRNRIKFIMGDDSDAEDEDGCKKSHPASADPPKITSELRLRTSNRPLKTSPDMLTEPNEKQQHGEEGEELVRNNKKINNIKKRAGSGASASASSTGQQRKSSSGKNKASSTSNNRTRSRFFSRFNKRTIRAVVLLVVKLCGFLVASILIPSSKQLVTAIGSGLDDQPPHHQHSDPPATNLDELMDEYGDNLDGYASSTIIAISPTNGNYHHHQLLGAGPTIRSNTYY